MSHVYVAGRNNYYDLGLGDNTQRDTHTLIAGEWLMIRSSAYAAPKFALGIKLDGTLWGVGDNTYKQLGGLAAASYSGFTQIGSLTTWADVACGKNHLLALKTDGTLWAVGLNTSGQCGQGNVTSPLAALTQIGSATWLKVFAYNDYSFAIKSDGTLWAWGANGTSGCLGLGTTTANYTTPQQVTLAATCSTIACGYNYVLAILTTGRLYAWGSNGNYQLGDFSTTTRTAPVAIGSDTTWVAVAAGFATSYGLKSAGTAWSWGNGYKYATAQANTSDRISPTQIGTATDWAQVAAGSSYQLLLKNTSDVIHVVGENLYGNLGTGFTADVTALTPIAFSIPGATVDLTGYYNASYLTVDVPLEYAMAPLALTVVNPGGIATAPMKLSMTASGVASAPLRLAVIDSAADANWSARCLIDGVDVSARLVGQASVTCDEGAARIASLTLLPASGAISPLDYVGKPISLDYVLLVGGTPVPRRLFTGRIDTPEYNPATTLLTLTCVDDLQNRVAALDLSVIDSLVGGRYSAAVQGEFDDHWDYSEARLSTVAGSLDAGASGGMRVTPWQIAATWATFGDGDLIYERPRLSLPQRSTLVNTVDIEFEYRYARLRQRYTTLGWSGTQLDMAPCGYQYPTQQDILGAAGGSGWTVTLGVFYPAPAAIPHSSGGFIYPDDGAIDMAILHLTQRHSQTVSERYTLQVTADESVALNGTLPHPLRGALESSFDGGAWESALDVAPLLTGGGEQDYAPDATRADADHAIDTLLDQARVKIHASHRGARVGNAILCNPDLDVDKKVAIATTGVTAAGKVASVVHVLDFNSGSATSEFEIAIFGAGGAGIIAPTTLAPPAPPAEAAETQVWPASIPSLFVNTYGVTPYSDGLMGLLINPPEKITVDDIPGVGTQSFPNPSYTAGSYPVTGFRVSMPGVDDADRNPLDKPVDARYSIIVPTDTLTFTVP